MKANPTKHRIEADLDIANKLAPSNAKKNVIGVLVLSGLLDPCGDIGTAGHYDLLQIPWTKLDFATKVSYAVHVDLGEKARIECQAEWYTEEDESDIKALARGIGIRAWIVKAGDRAGKAIMESLLLDECPESQCKKAAREIDRLSFHETPIDYPWPHENPDDEAAVNGFESVLLSRLESCQQAI